MLGFLARPRSKKRFVILSITVVALWTYSPLGINTPSLGYFSRPTVYSQALDHLKQPLCPRFNKYDRQKLQLLEPNECTSIQTEHPDFSADICFSPYTCNEGLVRVRRRDRQLCKEANLRYPISGNATHDAFHQQFSGPDSFHVVFSGSEKLSPPDWYHAGQCLYVFPFHISNPGKLSLDITHLYDSFGAIAEQPDDWPELWQRKIVSDLPLEICRGCPSRVAQPRFHVVSEEESANEASDRGNRVLDLRNKYEAYSLERSRGSDRYAVGTGDDLPLCSHSMAVQGAWLPAHPLDKKSWRRANYTWTPLGCTYGRPLDRTCLQGKKKAMSILFQGDSHLRVATEQLLRRLNGTNEIQTSTVATANQIEEQFGSTTFVFLNDPLFKKAVGKTDVLIANLGQWATGTRFLDNLWSTSKYHDKIRTLVDAVQQRARDLQDFEDEDADSTRRYLDGDDEHYGYMDEDDEDEDELEMEREILREKAKEQEDDDVYWDDETEEENIETQPKTRPSREEQEEQHGQEVHMVGGHKKGSYDRPRPRHPSDQLHRQSKPGQPPETGREGFKSKGANTNIAVENETRQRHRYPAQKRAIVNNSNSLVESTSSRRTNDSKNNRTRPIPNIGKPTANNAANRGKKSGSASGTNGGRSSPHASVDREAKIAGGNPSDDNRSGHGVSGSGLDSNRMSRNSIGGHHPNHHHDPEPSLRMLWAGMVAFPETQSVDSLFRHDWRTIYRLRYWNQIAEDVMLLHNIPFMDFFSMTLSMVDTSPDRNHYFGTDAAEAMLEELAFKLGLCEQEN